jgi:BirA family transcriptional regulator, biotin operon repressor / biotin---[acetyl-CoA-carboxylase] ligase
MPWKKEDVGLAVNTAEELKNKAGIYLIGSDLQGSALPLDSDALAAAHSVWEKEVQKFGPWRQHVCRFTSGDLSTLWRADGYSDMSTVFIAGRTTSSMEVIRKLLSENLLPSWGSVLAVEQSRGRGRRLRQWVSPPGNVYSSWYWPKAALSCFSEGPWTGLMPLLAAESLVAWLESKGFSARIKWPNDIIIDNRKVCGILVEDFGNDQVIGVGLNLVHAPTDCHLRKEFNLPAGCAEAAGIDKLTPLSFWTEWVEWSRKRIREMISFLSASDFVKMLERHLAWRGKKVLVKTTQEKMFSARIIGLAENGGLRLCRAGKEKIIYSGTTIPDF